MNGFLKLGLARILTLLSCILTLSGNSICHDAKQVPPAPPQEFPLISLPTYHSKAVGFHALIPNGISIAIIEVDKSSWQIIEESSEACPPARESIIFLATLSKPGKLPDFKSNIFNSSYSEVSLSPNPVFTKMLPLHSIESFIRTGILRM
jgi:hypothetical protein